MCAGDARNPGAARRALRAIGFDALRAIVCIGSFDPRAAPWPCVSFAVIARLLPRLIAGRHVARRSIILPGRAITVVIIAGIVAVVIAVEAVLVIVVVPAEALLLLLLPSAIIRQHTEIMIGELQIIFRIHPIARQLRIAGQVAIFFQQLRSIATRAIINSVTGIPGATIITAAAIWRGLFRPRRRPA